MEYKTHFILPPNEYGEPCKKELQEKIARIKKALEEKFTKATIRPPRLRSRKKA